MGRRVIDLGSEPAPVIMAGGINGHSHSQYYYIEPDGSPDPSKPLYAVPSMAEIAAIPWNGLTVASLFAGAGGSSTGYRMAGYRVLWASEFVPAAQESYRANMRAGTILDCRDVRQVQPAEILAATGLKLGDLDVLDGSPPCQAFSTAGKRAKGWGKEKTYEHGAKQRNEELFSEYIRILRGLMPRSFVAENVSGLVKGVAKGMFLEILADLKDSGYRVQARLLDAQWLGVPQQRSRVIFVGVREDLGLAPAFPTPLPHRYSVREAIPWLGGHALQVGDASLPQRPGNSFRRSLDLPCPSVQKTPESIAGAITHKIEPETDISRFAIGQEAGKLLEGQQSDRYPSLRRADSGKPCPTVTAIPGGSPSAARVIHPTEKRKFSIAEVKRLCAFPDDYVLTGSYAQQWERLGNSVPPVMMMHIASALRDGVLLPARAAARTAAPAARSPARSTNGRSRRDAAPSRPISRRPGATRTRAPAAARMWPTPRGPAGP